MNNKSMSTYQRAIPASEIPQNLIIITSEDTSDTAAVSSSHKKAEQETTMNSATYSNTQSLDNCIVKLDNHLLPPILPTPNKSEGTRVMSDLTEDEDVDERTEVEVIVAKVEEI